MISVGADNTKVESLIPIWVIHLGAGLDGPCESLPTQNILGFTLIFNLNSAWTTFEYSKIQNIAILLNLSIHSTILQLHNTSQSKIIFKFGCSPSSSFNISARQVGFCFTWNYLWVPWGWGGQGWAVHVICSPFGTMKRLF